MPQKVSLEESVQIRTNAARLFRELATRVLRGKHILNAFAVHEVGAVEVSEIGATLARLAFLDANKTSCLEVFTALEESFMETARKLERD